MSPNFQSIRAGVLRSGAAKRPKRSDSQSARDDSHGGPESQGDRGPETAQRGQRRAAQETERNGRRRRAVRPGLARAREASGGAIPPILALVAARGLPTRGRSASGPPRGREGRRRPSGSGTGRGPCRGASRGRRRPRSRPEGPSRSSGRPREATRAGIAGASATVIRQPARHGRRQVCANATNGCGRTPMASVPASADRDRGRSRRAPRARGARPRRRRGTSPARSGSSRRATRPTSGPRGASSQNQPAFIAAEKRKYFPTKPAVGGIPASERRKTSIAAAAQRVLLREAVEVVHALRRVALRLEEDHEAEGAEVHERVGEEVDEDRPEADVGPSRRRGGRGARSPRARSTSSRACA